MFCQKCGRELTDDANYCMKCGAPQRTNCEHDVLKYETCQIVWEKIKPQGLFSNAGARFWAEAIGLNGKYCAMQGEKLSLFLENNCDYLPNTASQDPNVVKNVNELITKLLEDGWESTGKGLQWYSYNFRRIIKN